MGVTGQAMRVWGRGCMGNLVPSSQFCCERKTMLKKILCKNKTKQYKTKPNQTKKPKPEQKLPSFGTLVICESRNAATLTPLEGCLVCFSV